MEIPNLEFRIALKHLFAIRTQNCVVILKDLLHILNLKLEIIVVDLIVNSGN
jgi:hypothetical protein